jgi:hypothetical protein
VLATNDSSIVTRFLEEQGFSVVPQPLEKKMTQRYSMSSDDFKTAINKLMREESEASSSNNIFRTTMRSGLRLDAKPVRYWKVDKNVKDPAHFSTVEVVDSAMELPDITSRLKVRKLRSPGSFSEASQEGDNLQPLLLQTITKHNITKHVSSPFGHTLAQVGSSRQSWSPREQPVSSGQPLPALQPMFTYEQKQRDEPSNIIQEMS